MSEGMMDLLYKQNLESAVRNALKDFTDTTNEEIEYICGIASALVDEGVLFHGVNSGESIDTYHIFLLEYIMRCHFLLLRLAKDQDKEK